MTVVNNGQEPLAAPEGLSFPCRILPLARNVGFAAAVNVIAQISAASFIATLNDDAEPEPEWLDALVRGLSRDSSAGMAASCIGLIGTNRLDSAGLSICLDGSSKQRGHGQPHSLFARPESVLCPSGCAALYRRQMLDEIGLFDEDFFLYCEDTDLGLRAQWAGWRCCYVPDAVVCHRYSSTSGKFSSLKARYVERNRIQLAIKNFPLPLLVALPFVSMLRFMWQLAFISAGRGAAFEFVRSGNSIATALRIIARAHLEAARALPSLLRKRASIRRTRRIGGISFIRLLLRHRITTREIARS